MPPVATKSAIVYLHLFRSKYMADIIILVKTDKIRLRLN